MMFKQKHYNVRYILQAAHLVRVERTTENKTGERPGQKLR